MPRRFAPLSLTVIAALALGLASAPARAQQDRYGEPAPAGADSGDYPAAQTSQTPQTFLSWPGKAAPAAPTPVAAVAPQAPPRPAPTSIYDRPLAPAAPRRYTRVHTADAPAVRPAAHRGLRGAYGSSRYASAASTRPAPPAALPPSPSATPVAVSQPPAPGAPVAVASAAGGQGPLPPRYYSVQREYGGAALPAQFFADTGQTDLAQPPPPPAPPALMGQAGTAATTAAIRQREAEAEASDDGTPGN